MDERCDRAEDFVRLGHAAGPEFAAGHLALIRTNDMNAVNLERGDVALGGGLVPHPHIHRRRDQDGLIGGEQRGRGKVGG